MSLGGRRLPDGTPDRRFVLVADDYGLSPGVSRAIRELLIAGKLTGTGCMTLFPEWPEEAEKLLELAPSDRTSIGLHLTLTDFRPLTAGPDTVAMPPLKQRLLAAFGGQGEESAIHAELDEQLAAFVAAMGHGPAYIDGHQHVHFLPVVRRWFLSRKAHLQSLGSLPWLRGAPSLTFAPTLTLRAKVAIVALMARGFDRQMRAAGYPVKGPLAGFYDWLQPQAFPPLMNFLKERGQHGMVVMCHPGHGDALLQARDPLVAARAVEFAELMGRDSMAMRARDAA
ncbi:ChbG/HpnK family deacetylase [Agrobacterium sp. a22-2]|uniref:ChbG/HpnK family deacetylase n=1 Tax=Agrobacterium sp. a22-2 TaxID=2283840 RepID=UPI001447E02D|nr:ChbG/HpnK family deacetylase [Agrobacterium sp. a22-2]NKN36539.1 ChbG/HpnK family deacetylase [Agrobacterium sp. a22-2]